VLDELAGEGEATSTGGSYAARSGAEADPIAEQVVEALREDFLEPRGVEQLARSLDMSPEACREILERLAAAGALGRAGPGLYFHADAIAEAKLLVAGICEREGSVTIAGLRDALATSRKYAQGLLEYLDAQRVTLRRGDEHVLRARWDAGGASVE
jgi:DNA-binding Lrp family transcriptional regulator